MAILKHGTDQTRPDQCTNPRNRLDKWRRGYRCGLNWRIWRVQARTEIWLKVVKIALSSFNSAIRAPQYPPLIFVAPAVQPPSPMQSQNSLQQQNY